MHVKQWAWVLAALPLSACFSGDADTVKQFVPDETPQYTLDQLLTHRKNCSTTTWRSFSDARGRKIVEYACAYAPAKTYLQEHTDKARKSNQEDVASGKRLSQNLLDSKRKEVQNRYDQLHETRAALAQAHHPSEALLQLESDSSVVLNTKSCADLAPDQFKHRQVIIQVRLSISTCQGEEARVRTVCSRPDKAWAGACNHVRSEAKLRSASELRSLASAVENLLKVEQRRAPERLTGMQNTIARIEAEIPLYEEEARKQEASDEASLAKREARSERLNAWLDRRIDAFKGVSEITQWTVVEGRPVHIGSRVDVAFGDAKVGTDVPVDFVYRNALQDDAKVSAFYQLLLDRLFWDFEGGFK